jgi:hypothetical protein
MPRKATWARIPDEGDRFGRLVATGNYELRYNPSKVQRFSECVCDCGTTRPLWLRCNFLYNGFQSCCGCTHENYPIAGTTFSRLTATGNWHWWQGAYSKLMKWECTCSCGSPPKYIVATKVANDETRSCGCLLTEAKRKLMDPLPYWKTAVFFQISRSSNSSDRVFSLSKDETWLLSQQSCHYCGIEPSNVMKGTHGRPDMNWSGLDRMDPTKGYIQGNVVPACWPCNRAKRDMTYDNFMKHIARICEHVNLKTIERLRSKA